MGFHHDGTCTAHVRQCLAGMMHTLDTQVDVFLHTYRLQHVASTWSGEKGVELNTTEWQLLSPKRTSFTSQQDFLDANECALHDSRLRGHATPD